MRYDPVLIAPPSHAKYATTVENCDIYLSDKGSIYVHFGPSMYQYLWVYAGEWCDQQPEWSDAVVMALRMMGVLVREMTQDDLARDEAAARLLMRLRAEQV